MTLRARFAPSPTGFLHIGGARTALFNWAFIEHFRAKGEKAEFLLRIEDTDTERSTQPAIDAILKAMDWLKLPYHGEALYQTKRFDRYREVANQMIEKGLAYYCYSTPEELDLMREEQKKRGEKARYDRRWKPLAHKTLPTPPNGVKPVIRFANPEAGMVHWQDLIKGAIAIDNVELDDFVILRADGVPTYNFANVVDDYDQAITHVVRGDDHVNNTPKQINVYHALGWAEPQFGHLPMIHGDDGEKLSKRHGAINVMEYREEGLLPEALTNYLARLGFSHGNDEIFSLDQLAEWFDWSHVQSSPARFDQQKLLWVNQHYLHEMSPESVLDLLTELDGPLIQEAEGKIIVADFVQLYHERCRSLLEYLVAIRQAITPQLVFNPEAQKNLESAKDVLSFMQVRLQAINDQEWNAESHRALFQECLQETKKKMGQLGVPLRIALLGEKQSPSVDKLLACFKPKWALQRLAEALIV